ncbi:MAG: cupin domain-containing protein [Pseudanabaena sp.]
MTPAEFCDSYYTKKAVYIEGFSEKFNDVFDFESLNDVLNGSPIPHPTMKLALNGKAVPASDAAGIVKGCRDGATIIIEQIHQYDSKVARLASSLSRELMEPVQVNTYFSQPNNPAFNTHYDTHDVFIVQTFGRKKWRVFEDTIRNPLFHQKVHGRSHPETPYLECILKAGDLLYVPRGHWHDATADTEPSLHLTVGIYSRTRINFLNWLVDELRDDERWRETFPFKLEDAESYHELSQSAVHHFEQMKDLLISKINEPSLLHDYRKFCVAQDRVNRPFVFPFSLLESPVTDGKYTEFSRPYSQRAMIERKVSEEVIEVTVLGKLFRFSLSAENLLRFIFASTVFDKAQLLNSSDLSWRDISIILDQLVRENIIEVTSHGA